ncbi:hypothetical protein PUMCH_000934 [Australozyma saopauloensis]|uniref:Symplekin/Pta1 N-terminal domain-containing protein n=1 Tax=Australozyma saopauloensis TaxID=291208 RepID=A0AAX4H5G9_9ASCO|nr:hypothetical protein PUMCH_000934 [[Candida] saopauloensis]
MEDESAKVIGTLNEARAYGLANRESLPQVVKQILNFISNPNQSVQAWCAKFLREVFMEPSASILPAVKTDLALDALPFMVTLANIKDLEAFKDAIDVSVLVYKLAFRFVAENDGVNASSIWLHLVELRNSMVAKFDSQFPFELSFDLEKDSLRNVHAKVELLKFIMTVIDYQLRSSSSKYFLIARVSSEHSQMKISLMETEAAALLDVVLKPLQNDILVTPLVTATLNHLSTIVRRKRQFMDRILPLLESFDTETKLQSNYESIETFKLSKKYVDRTLRVLLNYMSKSQVIPPPFTNSINRKIALLTSRGDDIRKKNILQQGPADQKIQKRPFEGFQNGEKKLKSLDYKNLYALTDSSSDLSSFDVSNLPQNILVSMTLNALNRASSVKLSKALDIIATRYEGAVKDLSLVDTAKVKKFEDEEEEDGADANGFEDEIKYTLPPPKLLSKDEKKQQLNLIVNNFIDLANKGGKPEDIAEAPSSSGVSSELTKVVVNSWQPDTWSILLTRLATRGMRTILESEDTSELSDIIRKALLDYFLASIHDRVDVAIEWLNEEWYSESVTNEQKKKDEVTEKWYKKYAEDPNEDGNMEENIRKEMDSITVETPTYNKWAQQLLDALIPFLEPTDRKIFLRMMSDLPALTKSMVLGIKSLCADPARSKLGFLSLQYLIMYRPPVKDYCLDVLREMATGDQEDLKEEAEKLLQKYQ